jgi:cob(I)alamin adenosyltransferase
MTVFYTGKGDDGQSDLGDGKKVDKSCIEIETLNVLDELNSLIGLVETKFPPPTFSPDETKKLEEWSDYFEKKVQPARGFVIPGVTEPSAWLHWLRVVSRRTELSIVHLNKTTQGKISPAILAYHNRLSSVFYAMARYLVKEAGQEEKNPQYR